MVAGSSGCCDVAALSRTADIPSSKCCLAASFDPARSGLAINSSVLGVTIVAVSSGQMSARLWRSHT